MASDWFEALTGFRESADAVRAQLAVETAATGHVTLVSRANGRRLGAGRLHLPSLAELRERHRGVPGRLRGRHGVRP